MRLTHAHSLYSVTVYSYTLTAYRPRHQWGIPILIATSYKTDQSSKLNTKG